MRREFEYTPLDKALQVLAGKCKITPRKEAVDLGFTYGRTLTADVQAKEDIPGRDSSHYDGFAVKASDIIGARDGAEVSLTLKPGVALGVRPTVRIRAGEASKVATGGYLPTGADTVVPAEDARVEDGRIFVSRAVPKGGYVYSAGQDVKKGERVLRAGRTLRAQDVVLLGSLRLEKVEVFAKPRVAIVPTGSELTDQIRSVREGTVFESHSIAIGRLVEESGGLPVRLDIVPDDLKALVRQLRLALGRSDLVLTLAGTSVGEPDLVESAIRSLGKPGVLVHGVRVNRGRVMGFGVVGGKAVIMLPGPIQAALNAFIVFGYPLIRSFLGGPFEAPPVIPATMSDNWEATGKFRGFDQIVYVGLRGTESGISATPGSGETEKASFLVSKDGYIFVPGGKSQLRKGDRVWVHLLPGFSGAVGR